LFNKKILECEQSNLPRLLAAAIKEKLHVQQQDGEPDDTILDNHLSRIWNDDTPTKSRSPPNRLSRKVPNILPRRKEKDQISYFSADSGNIHDYKSKSLDRLTLSDSLKSLKKKKNNIEMDSGISVSVLSGALPSSSSNNNNNSMVAPTPNSLERVHQWVEQCGSEERRKISPTSSRRMKKQQQYLQQLQQQIDESNNKKRSFRIPTFVYYEGEVPYGIHIPCLPGKSINLIQFKEHLPKKGDYRYFFKRNCAGELGKDFNVLEEINDDFQYLPLFEGKIIAHLQST